MKRVIRRLYHTAPRPENAEKVVANFSKQNATPLTLHQMYEFGKYGTIDERLEIARFVWKEVPVRTSHRIIELNNLPYHLSRAQSVHKLRQQYLDSFIRFTSCPEPKDKETEKIFVDILSKHLTTLGCAPSLLAQALHEVNQQFGTVFSIHSCPFLNGFLDRFFTSRIGTRLLSGQYVAMYNSGHNDDDWVGQIHATCRPSVVTQDAILYAQTLCKKAYGVCPNVEVRDPQNVAFKYIPDHLQLIMLELLKNSMCATVRYHQCKYPKDTIKNTDLPPIKVIIVEGEKDVTIKISDEGGGIPREDLNDIWNYFFTNCSNEPRQMAGFGYGLPISRVYARYFSGDLELISMDGHGTDAFVFLSKIEDSQDKLPYLYGDSPVAPSYSPMPGFSNGHYSNEDTRLIYEK